MKTINRMVVTLIPRQLYIDWANGFDDGGPKIDAESVYATSILIPDSYDEFNYEVYLKRHYKELFETELESWSTDPGSWPKKRDYRTFLKWFRVVPSDSVLEMGKGPRHAVDP